MLNLLWLLLPVAAAAGWVAARSSTRQSLDSSWDYARNFHRSLGALLGEGGNVPDDLFVGLADTDRDTADTQLAVGNLFRRRGEVNRAIHLHESLLDRPGLGADVRAAAQFELARDYDSAGLLDRSEQGFREVIASGWHREEAYECLLQLQESEHEWVAAIETAEAFDRCSERSLHALIAHYHCELANEAREAGDRDNRSIPAREAALRRCSDCARANMIRADMAIEDHDDLLANRCYADVERQRPDLMPEIIDRRYEVLQRLDDQSLLREFVDRLRDQRNAYS